MRSPDRDTPRARSPSAQPPMSSAQGHHRATLARVPRSAHSSAAPPRSASQLHAPALSRARSIRQALSRNVAAHSRRNASFPLCCWPILCTYTSQPPSALTSGRQLTRRCVHPTALAAHRKTRTPERDLASAESERRPRKQPSGCSFGSSGQGKQVLSSAPAPSRKAAGADPGPVPDLAGCGAMSRPGSRPARRSRPATPRQAG